MRCFVYITVFSRYSIIYVEHLTVAADAAHSSTAHVYFMQCYLLLSRVIHITSSINDTDFELVSLVILTTESLKEG